ncbi:hypothetical protein [Natrinema sp. H-ect4]|uniref:hypothetical protein n=1 Tax=Natrinema sp. H-ect4 TaxID=3242699 RepID=UPI0035A8DFF3
MITIERIITPDGFNPDEQLTGETGGLHIEKAYEQLQGVGIHGFNFADLESHGVHPVFHHEELDLRIYAVPNDPRTGYIHIQVEAGEDSVFRDQVHGQIVEELEAFEHLTVGEYLERVRDFIEENLLSKSRREELRSEEEQEG